MPTVALPSTPPAASGQTTPDATPNAPVQTPAPAAPNSNASIAGAVLDIAGSTVVGATVVLTGPGGQPLQTRKSGVNGDFFFVNLPPGAFTVTITSPGLKTFTSPEILLAAGESRELDRIALPIADVDTTVGVHVTQQEVAHDQVKAQEQQRVLGILPNFYSSYIWNAAPMTAKLKFGLATRSVVDPVAFMVAAGVAGVEQSHNTFPGYGPGPQGYAKRYGAAYADNVVGKMIGSALLPSLFHQDPRYFYRGSGSIPSRAAYAIGAAFICRGDNGRLQPNYSHILGNFAAAGLSNLYRDPMDRNASLTVRNGAIITASNAAANLIREFLLRKMTSKVPASSQGKP